MSYSVTINQLVKFLRPNAPIWQDEILFTYPHWKNYYPTDWIDELASLNENYFFEIEGNEQFHLLESRSLKELIQSIQEFEENIPSYSSDLQHIIRKLPFNKIKGKKEYEIKHLCQYIKNKVPNLSQVNFIDFAGGMGHLAQNLAFLFENDVTSIDFDKELQKQGLDRYQKIYNSLSFQRKNPKNTSKVNYLHQNIFQMNDIPSLRQQSCSIGLHTCGGLASHQIKISMHHQLPYILNMGCCYYKMKVNQDIPLSRVFQTYKFPLTEPALTLANRAHGKVSRKAFDFKNRVKSYRYTFELLLHEFFNRPPIIPLGTSVPHIYKKDFAGYVEHQLKTQLEKLNDPIEKEKDPKLHHYRKSLVEILKDRDAHFYNNFFGDQKIKTEVHRMIIAGFVRAQFGLPLEYLIQLDRCCFLEENGYKAQIHRIFQTDQSPRGLLIFASKN